QPVTMLCGSESVTLSQPCEGAALSYASVVRPGGRTCEGSAAWPGQKIRVHLHQSVSSWDTHQHR
ncbi:hypothetical protein, partial [Candidatus Amarolinea aalborgensis]|uniref:hypothetical protein n=1 Tax=Candidatus Amarolinea aalborgensis TaxID=2249329 RepID=UPI003BF9BFFF